MTAPIEIVLNKLAGAKKQGSSYIAKCPAHEDNVQSLSVSIGTDDRVLLNCHAGCDLSAVLAGAGLETKDLFVLREKHDAVSAEYRYVDERGDVLYVVERRAGKRFLQKCPTADGWSYRLNGVRRVPYRMPQLLQGIISGRWIAVVEGEKDAEALIALGFIATTNAGGACKWRDDWASMFTGARVVILPDNDGPGAKHAVQVAMSLAPVASEIRVLELDVPEHGDVSDWLAAGGTADELKTLIRDADVWCATDKEPSSASEGTFRLRRGSDVEMLTTRWAWERRIPLGGLTLIPGREGLGKTTLAYELAARGTRGQLEGDLKGEPFDVIVIGHEDTIGSVAKPRLLAAGADMARVWFLESADPEIVGAFSVPEDVPALNALLTEVSNPRMVIVDPLDAHLGVDTHKKADTQRAIGALALIAQQREAAILGIAHHSKAATADPLDRVIGSKAFTTTSRSVLTIAPHPENDEERVIACSKANLTRRETIEVLRFKIEERTVTEGDVTATTSGVVWLGVAEGVDPDSVLARPVGDDDAGADAKDVLAEILADGPMWVKQALDAMVAAGFSQDQAKRAKEKVARSVKVGAPGDTESGWKWVLRTQKRPEGCEERNTQDLQSSHPSASFGAAALTLSEQLAELDPDDRDHGLHVARLRAADVQRRRQATR